MRSVRISIGSVFVGMCLAALIGCGGDTSTPKGAAKTMIDAMKKGDAATVKSVTVNGDPKFIDMMVAMVSSNQQLQDAAVAKFGADGNSIGEAKMLGDVDKKLDDAEVKENGDTATITTKDSREPMTLKKVDGQWKVDLSQMPQMPGKDDPSMQPMFNAMLDVNKQLAADISAGKYKTAAEAKQAGQEKLMAAMMSLQKPTPK
jgi:hypothetical protein